MSLDMSTLILKVQQRPELKTWIRNSDVYLIVVRLLLSFRQERVLVNIEHTPRDIVLQILIFASLGDPVRGFL